MKSHRLIAAVASQGEAFIGARSVRLGDGLRRASGLLGVLLASVLLLAVSASPASATPVPGYHYLQNVNSSLCANVQQASTANGAAIIQWHCGTLYAPNYNDNWALNGSGPYEIVGYDGKCLNVKGASLDNSAEIIQWDCNGAANELWRKVNVGSDPNGTTRWEFINVNSGKCLNVKQASTADGAPIIQYTCDSTALNGVWRWY